MKTLPKLLAALFAFTVVTEAHAMRWYSPDTGRWLSRDPIGERGGPNLYGFVRNSPCNHFDARGLMTLSHLGGGFQFVPDSNQFWLGLYSRFDADDYKILGGNGQDHVQAFVASRAKLTWSIRPCCDDESFAGSARAFFLDAFSMPPSGEIVGGARATPELTDRSGALYFNPINTTATELRSCSSADKSSKIRVTGRTEGVIELDWKARLLSKSDGIMNGFSDEGMLGTIFTGPAPFGVEANHKWVFIPETPGGTDGPEAWTLGAKRTVTYNMKFEWSDCDGKKRRFSPSPTLPVGLQRMGRGPEAEYEVYREAMSEGY